MVLPDFQTTDALCNPDIEYDLYFNPDLTHNLPTEFTNGVSTTTELGVNLGYRIPHTTASTLYRERTDLTSRSFFLNTADNSKECAVGGSSNPPYYAWQVAKNEWSIANNQLMRIQRRIKIVPDCA
jgi:hypothetical protein